MSACLPCAPGYVCNDTALTFAAECPQGSYCPAGVSGSINLFPCPAGTYGKFVRLATSSQCTTCPPGKYCIGGKTSVDGNCNAGYVCPLGAAVANPGTTTYVFDFNSPLVGG